LYQFDVRPHRRRAWFIHSEICGGMLFAAVIVVERRDGPRRQRDSDDDDGNDDGNSAYAEKAVFARYYLPPDRGDIPASGADVQRTLKRCSLGRLTRVCSANRLTCGSAASAQHTK